ncbi:MAG: aminoacyl-tRNA hydrolase [Proteobacteria bacterium]|nr:aminoacyl-tRNA hydrolase [Pseudomonadota bacterium]
MQVIFGLGNPGSRYDKTRHNAGFWYVDALAEKLNVTFQKNTKFHADITHFSHNGQKVWLVKPDTFMNLSGRSVIPFVNFYRIQTSQVLVAYDEIDLNPGTIKIKLSGGHSGHNGLRDIIPGIGKEFNRLRIGVGRPAHKTDVVGWVLGRPSLDDSISIDRAIQKALSITDQIIQGDLAKAMNILHSD